MSDAPNLSPFAQHPPQSDHAQSSSPLQPLEQRPWVDAALWLLHRNPLYLLSAAAMALGARLLLVQPDTRAGDLGNILLTLVVLQLYEAAVSAILLALHAYRKSPEDLPSLLLVAAVFWTGPLAATSEMIARDHQAGIGLSLGLACLAAGEFEFVRRRLGLQMSGAARAVALGFLALIAVLPGLLVSRSADGRANELALLAGWWVIALFMLLAARAVRQMRFDKAAKASEILLEPGKLEDHRTIASPWFEPVFLVLMLAATCTHLIAMNHAFFLHATPAYAAPAVILVAWVVIEAARFWPTLLLEARIAFVAIPALGLLLATATYDARLVEPLLTSVLRKPIYLAGILAGLTWWYAAYRGFGAFFLHLGSIALVSSLLALVAMVPSAISMGGETTTISTASTQTKFALVLVAGAAYFLITAWWRKSRVDAAIALTLLATAAIAASWQRVPWDRALAGTVLFWWWLATLLVLYRRPTYEQLTWLAIYGVLITLMLDFHSPSQFAGRLHAPLVPAALATLWYLQARKDCALLALSAFGVLGAFLLSREAARNQISPAMVVIGGSFAILTIATAVSWFKRELVGRLKDAGSTIGGTRVD